MNQLNRRSFIKQTSAVGAGALALTLMPTKLLANNDSSQKLPYSPLSTHIINRTSFGLNTELESLYQDLGYEGFIDYQLDADNIDDSEIENYIAANFPTVSMTPREIRDLINDGSLNQFEAAGELKNATYLRAVYSKRQLHQVMVEFWNNHFSVFHLDGPISFLKTTEDREVMRPLALSTFSEILHADAKSPAMIYYLDTFSSVKEAPNENYARELMELHTLGVDGPYTHFDIDEVARSFTGWQINQRTGEFRFNSEAHDTDAKIVLGKPIAAGGGVTDGEQVIDILANEPSTAAFISYKLCQHFISDNPDKSIVNSTTAKFIATGGDIKQCLRHILLSKHFILSRDQKLKRPFNYLASVVRILSGDVLNNRAPRVTRLFLEALGHQPFNWATPDGYPNTAGHWESTTGMLYRWGFTNLLCFDELEGHSYEFQQVITEPYSQKTLLLK
ncbi:MAG: DUF1800 domain-containing protein [Proteobacteria bacterium]|nr:DUF1800 domain-containing protein [Pseudomonadota bacterium]